MSEIKTFKSTDVDRTYGEGVDIKLKVGMAFGIYSDDGPGGPCGQDMRTTCPHTVLHLWPNEDAMRKELNSNLGRNKKGKWTCGVVDGWSSPGIFRVVNHDITKAIGDMK